MGVFQRYLERDGGARGVGNTEQLSADAAEFLRHGVRSMIAEGQDPAVVYDKAFPIYGEEFLIEAGIADVIGEAIDKENK